MALGQQQDSENWWHAAACRGPNQRVFYPPSAGEPRREKRFRERRAKAICDSCLVQADCLEHAIVQREQHGIWGGMTESERRSLGASTWS